MPQFEQIDTFISQIFWLVISFAILYFLMVRVILPRLGEVIEGRQDKIEDDLLRAEKLRSEADALMAEFEAQLSTARDEGHAVLQQASDEIKRTNAERLAKLNEELNAKIGEAELRISEAKRAALGDIQKAAHDVCASMTEKLVGNKTSKDSIDKAISKAGELSNV